MLGENYNHDAVETFGLSIPEIHLGFFIVQPMKQLPSGISKVKEW